MSDKAESINKSIEGNRGPGVLNPLTSSKNNIKRIAERHSIDGEINSTQETTLEKRLDLRIKKKQLLEQANLEQIIKQAYEQCNDETSRDPDPDWLVRFIEMAQQIHNPSMQKLWARILKQEIIQPGAVSLRTLNILLSMTHREAVLFQKTLMLTCSIGNDKNKKLLTSIKQQTSSFSLHRSHQTYIDYNQYHLPYSSILILTELGLLLNTELETNVIGYTDKLYFTYYKDTYSLSPIKKGTSLTYYRLSPIGQELALLIGSHSHDEYKEQLNELLLKYFSVVHQN